MVDSAQSLPLTDGEADQRFRALAAESGVQPDSTWVGGYVDYEWRHARHLLDNSSWPVAGKPVLEFGCNVGATAVVLAALGARVVAVDVNPAFLDLAALNAQRYGYDGRIKFVRTGGVTLPFEDGDFEFISCNAVLDYVARPLAEGVMSELDRVLVPGGVLAVLDTSNRWWPREAHSKRWLLNYLPPSLITGHRGVSPWRIRGRFAGYEDLLLSDHGAAFLEAKRRMGASERQLRLIAAAGQWLRSLGVSVGMLMPNFCLILRKR